MKHIALDKWGMSESDIAGEMNRSNTRSTHKYLIRLMMEKIRLVNKGAIVAFKAQIGGLKKLREASDYSDEQIDMGKSMEALDTSRKVKQCLIDNLV